MYLFQETFNIPLHYPLGKKIRYTPTAHNRPSGPNSVQIGVVIYRYLHLRLLQVAFPSSILFVRTTV